MFHIKYLSFQSNNFIIVLLATVNQSVYILWKTSESDNWWHGGFLIFEYLVLYKTRIEYESPLYEYYNHFMQGNPKLR